MGLVLFVGIGKGGTFGRFVGLLEFGAPSGVVGGVGGAGVTGALGTFGIFGAGKLLLGLGIGGD